MNETEFKSRWLTSSTVRSFELGAISPEVFAKNFVNEWSLPVEPEVFLAEFASWPKGFYPGALELLARLRRQSKVGCLSNSNSVHWVILPLQFRTRPMRNVAPVVEVERGVTAQPAAA